MVYKLTNCTRLTIDEILVLYNNGDIIFLDKYEIKFKEIIKINNI